jgi:hypothetical protein
MVQETCIGGYNMTKEEAHYGEVHFCSFCKHISFRYGDYYCAMLAAPVAESGFCDVYEKDGKPTPSKPTVVVHTCSDCVYNMGGMCGKTGELAKKACALYADVVFEPQIVVADVVQSCETCIDAYYNDAGIAMCRRFDAQLDLQDLTACEEYQEDSNESNEDDDN